MSHQVRTEVIRNFQLASIAYQYTSWDVFFDSFIDKRLEIKRHPVRIELICHFLLAWIAYQYTMWDVFSYSIFTIC